jgi:hypothetical protein
MVWWGAQKVEWSGVQVRPRLSSYALVWGSNGGGRSRCMCCICCWSLNVLVVANHVKANPKGWADDAAWWRGVWGWERLERGREGG